MHLPSDLRPKLLDVLREGLGPRDWLREILAGLVVGLVALPLAIAFGIASGVTPQQGLVTAVVAGFLISLLSGCRVQIGGPTGAFVALVALIVAKHGVDGLLVATMLAGGLLLALGLARMGTVIQYIPYPVTVGFTAGIAAIIIAGQLGEVSGLAAGSLPAWPPARALAWLAAWRDWNAAALALSLGTALLVWHWPKLGWKLPGSLVAIVVGTLLVRWLGLPVETVAGRFGEVVSGLDWPRLPRVGWSELPGLLSPALSIALLGGIESLLSAVVADGMTGRRHRSSMELVAQGVANLVTPLFGGIPATGAIARTATNIKSGGRTPIAGLVHALTLLLVLLVLGRWAGLIPLPVLAGILLVVALHMGEWSLLPRILRGPKSDGLVLLTTLALTVFVDLSAAIQVGVVLASLLFMRRMAETVEIRRMRPETGDADDEEPLLDLPPGIEVFEVNGPFFFGAADKFKQELGRIEAAPVVLVLRMRHVPALDATALRALEDVAARCAREGTRLLLSGVQPQPRRALAASGLLARLGEASVLADFPSALRLAGELARVRRAED